MPACAAITIPTRSVDVLSHKLVPGSSLAPGTKGSVLTVHTEQIMPHGKTSISPPSSTHDAQEGKPTPESEETLTTPVREHSQGHSLALPLSVTLGTRRGMLITSLLHFSSSRGEPRGS